MEGAHRHHEVVGVLGGVEVLLVGEPATHGADSEVGGLQTVMLHRPGPELTRLTPRNNDQLLFDGVPWVARAQEEHDAFAEALRERGVEVLHVAALLTDVLSFPAARAAVRPKRSVYSRRLGTSASLVRSRCMRSR